MDRKEEVRENVAKEKAGDVAKKAYAEPKLSVHGKVEDITKNIFPGGGSDGVYGSQM